MPGNVKLLLRRKNSPASRSTATQPSGIVASQPCSASSAIASWKRVAAQLGVEVVEARQLEVGECGHLGAEPTHGGRE